MPQEDSCLVQASRRRSQTSSPHLTRRARSFSTTSSTVRVAVALPSGGGTRLIARD